jgi:hypothetical protein
MGPQGDAPLAGWRLLGAAFPVQMMASVDLVVMFGAHEGLKKAIAQVASIFANVDTTIGNIIAGCR